MINQFQWTKSYTTNLKWKLERSSMKKLISWKRVSEEWWTNLKSNIKIYFKWWKSRSIKKSSNCKRKKRRLKKEKKWLRIKEMSWNRQSIKWSYIKMRSDSTYSMRRKERISKSCQHLMTLSSLTLILCTTCSKTPFMLMTMDLLKKHYLNFHPWTEVPKIKQTFICLEMILIPRLVSAMM